VAEYPGQESNHDSYVITIDASDTVRLAHARLLADWVQAGADLENAPDDRIVMAEIAAGADGINRNALEPGMPEWSWHIVGEVTFVGASIEILDGWPTFVEEDVEGWIANTNGFIAFWGYTVVRELGPVVPEPGAELLGAMGLAALVVRRRRAARFTAAGQRRSSPVR
jgi:MYXO-CTERM domain-containing protein